MDKGNLAIDPRGLLFEAYRMEDVTGPDCRTIFLDWALGLAPDEDHAAAIQSALDAYAGAAPGHPMTAVLTEGLAKAQAPRRRGGPGARPRG
ncbi:MAG: hypothetical protein AAF245_03605 [Pseudomonadota bacterium]